MSVDSRQGQARGGRPPRRRRPRRVGSGTFSGGHARGRPSAPEPHRVRQGLSVRPAHVPAIDAGRQCLPSGVDFPCQRTQRRPRRARVARPASPAPVRVADPGARPSARAAGRAACHRDGQRPPLERDRHPAHGGDQPGGARASPDQALPAMRDLEPGPGGVIGGGRRRCWSGRACLNRAQARRSPGPACRARVAVTGLSCSSSPGCPARHSATPSRVAGAGHGRGVAAARSARARRPKAAARAGYRSCVVAVRSAGTAAGDLIVGSDGPRSACRSAPVPAAWYG